MLVFVDDIEVRGSRRAVNEANVARLSESMKQLGLRIPISVYLDEDDVPVLVTGLHRVEAAKRLGWETIEAERLDHDDDKCRLWEIDENLCRAELTPTEEAEHLAERQKVWERIRGTVVCPTCNEKIISGGDAVWHCPACGGHSSVESDDVCRNCREARPENIVQGSDKTPGRPKSGDFARETARATGRSKSTISQATKRAREVCQEARDLIRGTPLDTGTMLDQLTKIDEGEQVEYVRRALESHANKERQTALKREKAERDRDAKDAREAARNEACDLLLDRLSTKDWDRLVHLIHAAGGALKASDMQSWMPVPA